MSKTPPPERLPFLLDFLQQPLINVAFPRFLGDQIPQVAHLGLADAVDSAESLFQPIRIPGQIVVHHQVRALEIDAFAGGVGGEQDLNVLVLLERFLRLASAPRGPCRRGSVTSASARPSSERNRSLEVVQRVAMLGEDDQLAAVAVGIEHLGVVLQAARELLPLLVGARRGEPSGQCFEVPRESRFQPRSSAIVRAAVAWSTTFSSVSSTSASGASSSSSMSSSV